MGQNQLTKVLIRDLLACKSFICRTERVVHVEKVDVKRALRATFLDLLDHLRSIAEVTCVQKLPILAAY